MICFILRSSFSVLRSSFSLPPKPYTFPVQPTESEVSVYSFILRLLPCLLLVSPVLAAEPKPAEPVPPSPYADLKARFIGPAICSGRVVAIAVHPQDHNQYYVAAASGGVWKTVNAGTTWTPVFDNEGSYSIGDIVL